MTVATDPLAIAVAALDAVCAEKHLLPHSVSELRVHWMPDMGAPFVSADVLVIADFPREATA